MGRKKYINYDMDDYEYDDDNHDFSDLNSYNIEDINDDCYDDYNCELDEDAEDIENLEDLIDEDINYEADDEIRTSGPLFTFMGQKENLVLLTREEELELGRLVKEGTSLERQQAIQTLIERNLRLVVHIAKKYDFPKVDMDDLIQEGIMGLMKAAEKYDYTKKYKFGTYATYWIRQAITRRGAEQSRSIRLPAHMIAKRNMVKKALAELKRDNNDNPTYEEIAELSGLTITQVQAVLEKTRDSLSLDETVDSSDTTSNILDFVDFGQLKSVDDLIEEEHMAHVLKELLAELSPRERTVIIMRNGLFGEKEMNVRELSEVYGISRERIRQICKEAVIKMSKKSKNLDFEEVL